MRDLYATRYRIYPTPEQEALFLRISGCCRLVYNLGLAQRRDFWRQYRRVEGKVISWFSQKAEITALKADGAGFLAEAPAHCLQAALKDLDAAFVNFFAGRAAYPRFRRKGRSDSFRFPDPEQITLRPSAGLIALPKFGKRKGDGGAIRAVFHRPVRGRVRSVTIVREGAFWFASVLFSARVPAEERAAREAAAAAPLTADDVEAVDRNVVCPFVTSSGLMLGEPAETPARRGKRSRLQRQVSRTERGSKRRGRALERLRRHDAKTARKRRDTREKVSCVLAKTHRVIVREDLPVVAMTASARGTAAEPGRNVAQKAGLNRSVLDKSWGGTMTRTGQKLAKRGGRVISVPAAFSSQTCPACLRVDAASRVTRDRFVCSGCGHGEHADVAAAKEIRRRGLVSLRLA